LHFFTFFFDLFFLNVGFDEETKRKEKRGRKRKSGNERKTLREKEGTCLHAGCCCSSFYGAVQLGRKSEKGMKKRKEEWKGKKSGKR
jgi:hypothetical protein